MLFPIKKPAAKGRRGGIGLLAPCLTAAASGVNRPAEQVVKKRKARAKGAGYNVSPGPLPLAHLYSGASSF